jgi:hypothetical protein
MVFHHYAVNVVGFVLQAPGESPVPLTLTDSPNWSCPWHIAKPGRETGTYAPGRDRHPS